MNDDVENPLENANNTNKTEALLENEPKIGSYETKSNKSRVESTHSQKSNTPKLSRSKSRISELEQYDRKQTTKKIVKVHKAAETAQKAYFDVKQFQSVDEF